MDNNLPHGGVRFFEPEDDNFDDDAYEEWRKEQFAESWDDICSNIGIELDDVSILIGDEALREMIIEEHDRQFPGSKRVFTEEEYEEEMRDRNENY